MKTRHGFCAVTLGLALAGLTSAPLRAAETSPETWQFEITPYYDKNNFLWKIAAHGAYVGLGIAF
jgi:hypothetical protein